MKTPQFDKKVAEYLSEASARYKADNGYDVDDFKNFISHLENVTELDMVCRCVFHSHRYKTFPKLAAIKEYLNKAGIKIKPKRYTPEEDDYCYQCTVCGSFFETGLGWCPVCYKKGIKNTETKTRVVRSDWLILKGHSGCAVCPKWSERNMGCCCKEWGKGRYDEMCKDCDCLECCKDEYMRHTNYREYKIKHGLMGTRIMNKDCINRR